MKYMLTAGALLISTALAQAQATHWTFTYTGFYDQEAATFLADATLSGSFYGVDANGDGVLERDELSSLLVGTQDYVACAAGSNATYHCGADSFRFSPEGGLSFSVGEYGGDPEGWVGRGHIVTTGEVRYDYEFNPGGTTEHHLAWTDGTKLAMSSALVSAVPEAPSWAMLAAGLAGIGGWSRRKRRRGV